MLRWPAILPLFVVLSAHDDGDSLSDRAERIDLNGRPTTTSLRVTQSMAEPMATAGPLAPQDALRGERADAARQTMLWAEHTRSGLGVGVGVEQRGPYNSNLQGQPQTNAGMLMGVSLATSARSHITVQTPLMMNSNSARNVPMMSDDPNALTNAYGQRQVRVGLTFNSKKPLADLRQGVRMEINGQTTMAVKLRGGRLGFAFQKVW